MPEPVRNPHPFEPGLDSHDGLPPPRAFGTTSADLALDFDATDRLVLATIIAAQCTHAESRSTPPEHAAHAWAMPVSTRIARLLRIVARTEETDMLEVTLRCPDQRCGGVFEINLPLSQLLDVQTSEPSSSAAEPVQVALDEHRALRLRRPTGNDQRAWQKQTFASPQDALLVVARSLILPASSAAPESLDIAELERLAEAMEEADPLTAFRIVACCPHCSRENNLPLDLEAEALRHLAAAQRRVLRDIHILATHYGWTEPEILAVPPKRRARYIRMIENTAPSTP